MTDLYRTALISAALLATPALAHAEDDTVTVGFPVALSGFVAPYDDGPRKAALLAIDDINASGGLLGKKIASVEADTKSDPGEGANAAADVLGKGAIMVMVTCDFDFGAPAALVAQAQNKIAFSSCAADPKFGAQGIGNNAYTMSTASIAQGALLAEYAYNELNFRKAFILNDLQVEYNKSLCQSFRDRFTELAGTEGIVDIDAYNAGNDTSIAPQITRIKSHDDIDVIMFCGAINGGSYVRQIRAAGIDEPMLAGESMDGSYWLEAVPDLSNFHVATYGSIFGDDPDPKVNDFMARFRQKYGEPPVTAHSMTGYSVIEAWAEAVKRAGTFDTDAVRGELDKFKDVELLVGSTSFTPDLHINTDRPMTMLVIENGKHQAVGSYAADKVPEIKF